MPTQATDDAEGELQLLQAIRLKGRVAPEVLATVVGGEVDARLRHVVDGGLVSLGKIGAKLTQTGRERLAAFLELERATLHHHEVVSLYEAFHAPNRALKDVVTAWQMFPDGTLNDHSDAAYDAGVIARLEHQHGTAVPLLDRVVTVVGRLASYPLRLRHALERALAGEHAWFANPMVDSYHQVWFELHEELIGVLGLSRTEEARAGRA